jgi:hypothetical protein
MYSGANTNQRFYRMREFQVGQSELNLLGHNLHPKWLSEARSSLCSGNSCRRVGVGCTAEIINKLKGMPIFDLEISRE